MSSILTGSTISTHSQSWGLASMEIVWSHAGGMAKPKIACSAGSIPNFPLMAIDRPMMGQA